jgi:nicotinate phosphoribosyltransferase
MRDASAAPHVLLTDLYQINMLQAYWREGMRDEAVFSLLLRRLPERRNYVLACGLDDALGVLESLRFADADLTYLASLGTYDDGFLAWLRGLRFTGSVRAVPDGTPIFPFEPILEVAAPIAEAQLAESLVMNQVHLQTVLATKAARVVHAARGRTVVDFGMRRMHGADAALKGARAFYVAGVDATSNVRAGQVYGIPVAGTMAHSYVQAHEREADAFRAFAELYPETILLVDTYDTLAGVEKAIALCRSLGSDVRIRGIRLDSGDLADLARRARALLDRAGLPELRIFASGDLDEERITALLDVGAPIDAFGVGTRMGISADAPSLDLAYKLVEYAGRGRLKTSTGKATLPGRKQVFRREEAGVAVGDALTLCDERVDGRPLLEPVMSGGKRLEAGRRSLAEARARAGAEIARLPLRLRSIEPARPPYPVETSETLRAAERLIASRTP